MSKRKPLGRVPNSHVGAKSLVELLREVGIEPVKEGLTPKTVKRKPSRIPKNRRITLRDC